MMMMMPVFVTDNVDNSRVMQDYQLYFHHQNNSKFFHCFRTAGLIYYLSYCTNSNILLLTYFSPVAQAVALKYTTPPSEIMNFDCVKNSMDM
jgi:hypothetical protein